jgi:hypothetical protein
MDLLTFIAVPQEGLGLGRRCALSPMPVKPSCMSTATMPLTGRMNQGRNQVCESRGAVDIGYEFSVSSFPVK